MSTHEAHLARLHHQLERAVALSGQPDAPGERVAALIIQQRGVIVAALERVRELHGRDIRLLAIDEDPALCTLYMAVAGAFGIACDVTRDAADVADAQRAADHALVLADSKLQDAIAVALSESPRPMLIMTPAVADVSAALASPFMERSLGMLIKPFELEPLAYIIVHWTLIRLMAG
ncbi:MAG TPA: hypothetical protein VJ276_09515 [Thermoanaerobaculia bacterium]|nr:hypothetical protein [Thermoanaerobaculia bacterium]